MKKRFVIGFHAGFLVFVGINLLAAHLLSDCGLPSVFGMDYCADDIARAGWPFQFFEEGGFDYHSFFNAGALIADMGIGLILSLFVGIFVRRQGLDRESV